MIFYYNTNGELISYIPERIYQGSNSVNTIYFVSPVAVGNKVGVSFTLPNGDYIQRQQMFLASDLDSSITDEYGNNFSVYGYKVPFSVTKNYGTLICQFSIYSDNGEEVLTTESVNLVIERGVYVESPDVSDPISLAIDYSSSEKNSGAKWTNNADIYKRTVSITLNTIKGSAGVYTVNNSLKPDYNTIIKTEGFCELTLGSGKYVVPLNCYFPASSILADEGDAYVYIANDDGFIYVKYKLPCTKGVCKITMYYTKN